MDDDVLSLAISLFNDGHSVRAASRKTGVTYGKLLRRFKRAGIKLRPAGSGLRIDITPAEIAEEYLSGMTLDQVASKHGISVCAVIARLDKAGVARRKDRNTIPPSAADCPRGADNGNWIDLPEEEIAELYEDGMSATEIGRRFGVSRVPIYKRLRKAGVAIRHAGYRHPVTANDGHVVMSTLERRVDDWLYAHGIPHSIHPYVPWYSGGSNGQKADFLVASTYIEVWGIEGNAQYDRRRHRKQEQYRQCRALLVEVWPNQIKQSDYSALEPLLKHKK